MTQILLLRPADEILQGEGVAYEHLGLGYLAAYLRARGIGVRLLDLVQHPQTPEQLASLIATGEFSLVGIAASYQAGFGEAAELARTAKEARPEVHVTLGGHFATAAHDFLLRDYTQFDSVVRGEGEVTLHALASRIIGNAPLAGLNGLTHRTDEGAIVAEPPADQIRNLDDLPFPSRDCLPDGYGEPRWASLESSRGCPFRCRFCSIEHFYGGGSWRARSIENILDEMDELKTRHGCSGFYFADDNFIAPGPAGLARVKSFCEGIKARRLAPIAIAAMVSASCVSHDVIAPLYEAGLRSVLVGVESGSPAVLKRMRKAATPAINGRALEILSAYDIDVTASFIMFDPDSTVDDLKSNVSFLREHLHHYDETSLLNPLSVYYGTDEYDLLEAKGRLSGSYLEPHYEFSDPMVDWICRTSTALMGGWVRLLDDEARAPAKHRTSHPRRLRRQLHQQMIGRMLDVFDEVIALAETASREVEPLNAAEGLAESCRARLEPVARTLGLGEMLESGRYAQSHEVASV